jgi:hypothetical protein
MGQGQSVVGSVDALSILPAVSVMTDFPVYQALRDLGARW